MKRSQICFHVALCQLTTLIHIFLNLYFEILENHVKFYEQIQSQCVSAKYRHLEKMYEMTFSSLSELI